jgi:hypothetical protein
MRTFVTCLVIALGSLHLAATNTLPTNSSEVDNKVQEVCCTASHSNTTMTVRVCGPDGDIACATARAFLRTLADL